jgi:hypothetical protein
MGNFAIPVRGEVSDVTPLRLDVAAAMAFPGGSMMASGLHRECGRLVIERIAGNDYTTLWNIGLMRELCRVERLGHNSGCSPPAADVTVISSQPCGAARTVNANTS